VIEIYVYMEGANPKEVILGRRQAVDRLLEGAFKTNPDERRKISLFMEAGPCDLGSGLHIVGYPPETPDRRIIRVVGPGALV
jgi:hypothetical protein